jgi:hypothetical protein
VCRNEAVPAPELGRPLATRRCRPSVHAEP